MAEGTASVQPQKQSTPYTHNGKAMRCRIELDASALLHNYRSFRQLSQPATAIPVVKSNAYGHGLKQSYQIFKREKPPWLGVNYPEEGLDLRDMGYQGRIIVLGPTNPELFATCNEGKLEVILGDFPSLKAWQALKSKPLGHLKFDTGMSRQGFMPTELTQLLQSLKLEDKPFLYGVCSHFANVEDVLNHDYAELQLSRFKDIYHKLQEAQLQLVAHMASSASTLIMEPSLFAMTRIGISLYGLWPSGKARLSFHQKRPEDLPQLRPVLKWLTEVALTKNVREGEYIGYGCTYRAIQDMKLAVLPIGYYEGYPRLASGRGSYVLIRGKRCPIVGRICMNMMMVDISHLSGIHAGEPVTLIGQDGSETIHADELAEWAETIHYELVSRLHPAIPRHIIWEDTHEPALSPSTLSD